MIEVAVCDDDDANLEIVERCFEQFDNHQICYDVFESGQSLYDFCQKRGYIYNIYILDIEMNGLNGIELARQIREKDKSALVVFLTAYPNYVFNVFSVITFDYILKPLSYERFETMLSNAIDYLNMTKRSFCFSYKKNNYVIDYADIVFIEKQRRQAIIHTMDKMYQCNMTIKDIWAKLDKRVFANAYASCIVNLMWINKVIRDEIYLKSGEVIHAGRDYRREIRLRHMEFMGSMI